AAAGVKDDAGALAARRLTAPAVTGGLRFHLDDGGADALGGAGDGARVGVLCFLFLVNHWLVVSPIAGGSMNDAVLAPPLRQIPSRSCITSHSRRSAAQNDSRRRHFPF